MTRIVRFGDRALYKPSKTLKIDKTEASWKYGLWLGLFERAREHSIGTENDVIKCKAISPLSRDHQSDKDFCEEGHPMEATSQTIQTRSQDRVGSDERRER